MFQNETLNIVRTMTKRNSHNEERQQQAKCVAINGKKCYRLGGKKLG
jgi:hypothetical protein